MLCYFAAFAMNDAEQNKIANIAERFLIATVLVFKEIFMKHGRCNKRASKDLFCKRISSPAFCTTAPPAANLCRRAQTAEFAAARCN